MAPICFMSHCRPDSGSPVPFAVFLAVAPLSASLRVRAAPKLFQVIVTFTTALADSRSATPGKPGPGAPDQAADRLRSAGADPA